MGNNSTNFNKQLLVFSISFHVMKIMLSMRAEITTKKMDICKVFLPLDFVVGLRFSYKYVRFSSRSAFFSSGPYRLYPEKHARKSRSCNLKRHLLGMMKFEGQN